MNPWVAGIFLKEPEIPWLELSYEDSSGLLK